MAAMEEVVPTVVHAEVAPPAAEPVVAVEEPKPAEENPPTEKPAAKEKKPRAPKEKKPKAPKPQTPAHPTYFQMIKEAIMALKEKSGSSPYAIAKHMEEKYKAVLPANYKKMLTVQLRNCVAKGKLVKVKGSFKLSEEGKKAPSVPKKTVVAKQRKPKISAPAKKNKGEEAKKETKRKKPMASTKPAKKVGGVKKAKRATPAKAKQPKSIKSPAAKRAKKAAA